MNGTDPQFNPVEVGTGLGCMQGLAAGVVIGLAGLFIAHAWESGVMHAAGIALFVASGVIVFLNIKRVYDRINSEPH